jgi:hypothetical protein
MDCKEMVEAYLRFHLGISLEWLRETSVKTVEVLADIWTRDLRSK